MIGHNRTVCGEATRQALLIDSAYPGRRPGAPVYVFGDSLCDVGNLYHQSGGAVPPASRYFAGRFCDGEIWADVLVKGINGGPLRASRAEFDLRAGDSVSFAHGGAGTGRGNITPDLRFTVPGLLGQVELCRQALKRQHATIAPEALAVVCGGANDYLFAGSRNPLIVVRNLMRVARALHGLGCRRLLLTNLPNLGATPIAVSLHLRYPLGALTRLHNRVLAMAVRRLRRELRQTRIVLFDAHTLLRGLQADPAAYGYRGDLRPGPAAGCLLPPFDCSPVRADGTLFWDEIHPAAPVHRFIGEHACRALC